MKWSKTIRTFGPVMSKTSHTKSHHQWQQHPYIIHSHNYLTTIQAAVCPKFCHQSHISDKKTWTHNTCSKGASLTSYPTKDSFQDPYYHIYAFHNQAPPYLTSLTKPNEPSRPLRSLSEFSLAAPWVRTKTYGYWAFSFFIPMTNFLLT